MYKMCNKIVVISLAILMLLVMLSGCGAKTTETSPADPVIIGAIFSFTGPLAFAGPMFEEGIKMRLDEAGYEAGGRPLHLIIEDDAADVPTALDKIRKLIERDSIDVLIGPQLGGLQIAAAPYLAENNILALTVLDGSDDNIVKYGNWINYPGSGDTGAYWPLGWFAYEAGHRTMSTVGPDCICGHTYIRSVVEAFEEKGGTVVQQQWVPLGCMDFAPYLATLEDVDVVTQFVAGIDTTALFITQYRQFDKKPALLHVDIGNSLDLNTLGGQALGTRGQDVYAWLIDNPINQEFVSNFEAKYGKKPSTMNVCGYVVASILVEGLDASGGDPSLEVLRPAILDLEMETPQGPLAFTATGFGIANRYIFEVAEQNGEFVLEPVYTYENFVNDPWY